MKKKFGAIIALACVGLACITAGCSAETELEKYQKAGYTVMVTYDANGGSFLRRQGVTVMDLFKPSNYEKDNEGEVHIYLKEPTDLSRPTSGTGNVTLTKQEHFFAGWYEEREFRKNSDDQIVDETGAVLEEKGGKYYYVGTETEGVPAYTYSGHWDFETDTIDYKESDGIFEMTLYAAWVPYYQFEYYYRVEGDTDWTYYETTTFDYKTTNTEGSATFDKDTVWLPDWKDGTMNHEYRYANGSIFTFPKVEGMTFKAAYLDEAATQKIDASIEHSGTLDLEKGEAVNRVQKIYVEVEKGERYKIETAEQFSKYANLSATYEILADLDFKNGEVKWPNSFVTGEFVGKIYSVGGEFSFKNVVATVNSSSSARGGLFGLISANATVKDVKFENATMDFKKVSTRETDASYGLFAGNVAEGANVTNVTVGGKIRLGEVSLAMATDYKIHLIANGNTSGITAEAVALEAYGSRLANGKYQYAFKRDNVVVNDGLITLDYTNTSRDNRHDEEFVSIDYGNI